LFLGSQLKSLEEKKVGLVKVRALFLEIFELLFAKSNDA